MVDGLRGQAPEQIALASSAQVAGFLIPVVALLSWPRPPLPAWPFELETSWVMLAVSCCSRLAEDDTRWHLRPGNSRTEKPPAADPSSPRMR